MLPIVTLIGRTNVGKSSLFNILTKSRNALVANYPGLTRDRQYGICYLEKNKKIILVDTAGLDINLQNITDVIHKKTFIAIKESDIILFVVNAREGVMPQEHTIAQKIRLYNKKIILIINKIDGIHDLCIINEFYSLGFKIQHAISTSHKIGIHILINQYLIPFFNTYYINNQKNNIHLQNINIFEKNITKIAFIGRPNVGKSTLINTLLKDDRMITSNKPGTTLDNISISIRNNNKNYICIDTSGISKNKKRYNIIEKFSIIKTLQTIEKTNIAFLIIDATISISSQDLYLANLILNAGKSIIIVINKWDLLNNSEKQNCKNILKTKLKFLFFARIHFISALYPVKIFQLFKSVDEADYFSKKKIQTSILNNLMYQAIQKHQPPIIKGRRIKLKYAHFGNSQPPHIIIHGNQIKFLSDNYKKYLINFFYEHLKIKGTPIKITFKENMNPYVLNKK